MIPLLNDPAPITHAVDGYCEIRIPEDECDWFDDHPESFWWLVRSQFSRCAVVVTAVIYEEIDEEDDE